MTATEQINKFIEENTTDAFGSVLGYVRTRDALNIALARLDAAEASAAQADQERDDLRRQLREACNEVTDDVTRLQWLKSLIHESQRHIEVLSEGDLDAGYTCLREVQDLHDALKAMINGGES